MQDDEGKSEDAGETPGDAASDAAGGGADPASADAASSEPHAPGSGPAAGASPAAAAPGDEAPNDEAPRGEAPRGEAPSGEAPRVAVPRGRRLRGAAIFLAGALGAFLLMANFEQLAAGGLLGLLCLVVAGLGLLEGLGLFIAEPGETSRSWRDTAFGRLEGEPFAVQPLVAGPAALAVLLVGSVALGYEGAATTVLLSLALLVPAALRRTGLLVFLVLAAVYLPLLGVPGLWDPWETHYGEVAREIIARDDWISLWWAQENWFWSKPILIFWSEALSLKLLGVDCSPDANPLFSEWAIRLPACVFALSAALVVRGTVAHLFNRRAGALAALVLGTSPHFFLLAHQAITDMFLVANVTMALCMLLLALAAKPEETVRSVRFGRLRFGPQHGAILALVMLALPQALYLISRNVTFYAGEGFAVHGDEFLYGSGGNDGVPGNAAHALQQPSFPGFQPWLQGLLWLAALAGVIGLWLRKERRRRAICMVGFYGFCALAFMGKGIPGIAITGLVALLYLVASRRWNLLTDGELRVLPGVVIGVAAGFPWFVAMFVRHGAGFTDRLLVHDHINRLAQGVHGDKGSIAYFLEQLGVGLFPWVGLVPAAVLGWLWYQQRADEAGPGGGPYREGSGGGLALPAVQRESLLVLGLWFFAAFTLFSAMITKFHHYIFPAIPPAAILVGILLDRLWGETAGSARRSALATLAALLAPLILVVGVGASFGDLRGVVPEEVEASAVQDWVLTQAWPTWQWALLLALGAALLVLSGRYLWRARAGAGTALSPAARREDLSLAVAVAGGAMLTVFVGRDLSWETVNRPQGYERLIHLFVYNYDRPWPDFFDYRAVLTGIAVTGGVLMFMLALRAARPVAARGLVGLALVLAAWSINVYFVDLSPHWSMGPTFREYYAMREGRRPCAEGETPTFGERCGEVEPVIAWQMNWKGENFYTGNRVHAFVGLDNVKIKEWLEEHRGESAYFVLEHGRYGSFRSLLSGKEMEVFRNNRWNNKFRMVYVPEL
ncbi:MAG: glycosyltransferase family 39 protein [Myxococcota bacterium]